MKEAEVKARAFAMPLTSPAYPPGPYRFVNREFMVITYRTDPDKLRAVLPEPLEMDEPLVKYEFIRMPDSTGFGDYTETGQVIPVKFRGRKGGYTHCMFLNDEPPIAAGRELWGFPKKLANPSLRIEVDTLVGTLDYGPVRVATGTMGTSTKVLTWTRSAPPWRHQIFCSRSFRTSTAPREFASWSSTNLKTSPSKAPGRARRRFPWSLTRSRRLPNCPCSRSCRPFISSAISPSAWAGSPTTICIASPAKREPALAPATAGAA